MLDNCVMGRCIMFLANCKHAYLVLHVVGDWNYLNNAWEVRGVNNFLTPLTSSAREGGSIALHVL